MIRRALLLASVAVLIGCSAANPESPPSAAPDLPPSTTQRLSFLMWNVESGGNDPAVIAKQLAEFSSYDVVALNEVHSDSFHLYQQALGRNFSAATSHSGRSDRLMILFDSTRFELLDERELDSHNGYTLNDGNHRSPLVVRLRLRETAFEFLVMTNHLARGNADLRTEQAAGLREWARDQTLPIFAIGDFNFDYSFERRTGNEAFVEFLRDNVWKWVQPEPLVDTNWSDSDGDGRDNYPDSMLDFAFVAKAAKELACSCRVVVRPGDFPDDESTSDHRPVELVAELQWR